MATTTRLIDDKIVLMKRQNYGIRGIALDIFLLITYVPGHKRKLLEQTFCGI